ncbi:hypothetical protein IWW36_000360 [Coemansia brasiliensis]|uniref:WAPL domain-containing protein n=1 Tax=Coemansia brasiliensis TaxID=2650707 RepID=A0A9W8LZY2_9FUNG|nr:hypothetical protein IWW36_000360 [Coemansia brasiliensis]
MADPFASIRRKPAATYGRKALAARRLAQPASSLGSDHVPDYLHPSMPKDASLLSSSTDSESSDSNASSDESQKRTRLTEDPIHVISATAKSKRTALLAMSKLDVHVQASQKEHDSNKDSWGLGLSQTDLDVDNTDIAKPKTKRIVKDNVDIIVVQSNSKSVKPEHKPKSCSAQAITDFTLVDSCQRAKPRATKPKSTQNKKQANLRSATHSATTGSDHSNQTKEQTKRSARDNIVAEPTEKSDVWNMCNLLTNGPLPSKSRQSTAAGSKRRARHRPKKETNLPSSSPPSTPRRLLDSNMSSRQPSSLGASDSDSDNGLGNKTFGLETPKTHSTDAFAGPSISTSKRLQSRALNQNVVYKYGRARDNDDENDDDLASNFTRALKMPMLSNTATSQLLLEDGVSGSCTDGHTPIVAAAAHLPDHCEDGSGRSISSELFKRTLNDILRKINGSATGNNACLLLVKSLIDKDFCEELLGNQIGLLSLLRGIHRAHKEPLMAATAMILLTLAFSKPALMQTLVFERQALEMAAELLKAAAISDILTLRHRSSFETKDHYVCVAYICILARKYKLVSDELPISTYNLALSAFYGFTRKDDAAFLAMAPLLRSELHESGCLNLLTDRMLTWSISLFVGSQAWTPNLELAATGSVPLLNDSGDCDDMWMDFDLPEEEKDVLSSLSAGSNPKMASGFDNQAEMDDKYACRLLEREQSGSRPSSASIALELEILQFCATASGESQDEILTNDLCIPQLITLLAKSQQNIVNTERKQSVKLFLDMMVLVLQLLVNLANNSTTFSARFIACDGLDVVAKNVAIVSQRLAPPSASSVTISSSQKALTKEVSDLHYDVLLVTSALLTNMVDSDSSCVVHIGYVHQYQQCRLSKHCFPKCLCKQRVPLVELLAKAFVSCHIASGSADANIAAGYLAVLLGFLMREPEHGYCRQMIQKHLPQRNVTIIVEHIQKFMHISDTISKRFAGLLSRPGSRSHNSLQLGFASNTHAGGTNVSSISAPKNQLSAANTALLSVISSLSSV